MKNSKNIKAKVFKGAGYLIGAITGMVAAISAFVITGNIAVSIPLFAGLSIPLGISMEQKWVTGAGEKNKQAVKILIVLIATGVLFFFSVILFAKIL